MAARIALCLVLAACSVPSPPPPQPPHPPPAPDPAAKPDPSGPPADETLAQCLKRKGVRLYGASWCAPCHDQLELFGASAVDVPYHDCFPPDAGLVAAPECRAAGIDLDGPFPTWIFPDGYRAVGVRSLAWLAVSAECPLR